MKISNNEMFMLNRQTGKYDYVLSRHGAMHEQLLSRQLKALGSKGGKARAIKLTPDRRQEIAVNAAKTRWSKGEINGDS